MGCIIKEKNMKKRIGMLLFGVIVFGASVAFGDPLTAAVKAQQPGPVDSYERAEYVYQKGEKLPLTFDNYISTELSWKKAQTTGVIFAFSSTKYYIVLKREDWETVYDAIYPCGLVRFNDGTPSVQEIVVQEKAFRYHEAGSMWKHEHYGPGWFSSGPKFTVISINLADDMQSLGSAADEQTVYYGRGGSKSSITHLYRDGFHGGYIISTEHFSERDTVRYWLTHYDKNKRIYAKICYQNEHYLEIFYKEEVPIRKDEYRHKRLEKRTYYHPKSNKKRREIIYMKGKPALQIDYNEQEKEINRKKL